MHDHGPAAPDRRACRAAVRLALVLALVAAFAAAAGSGAPRALAAGGAPAYADGDFDGIDDGLEQTLANRFAPVILIERDESNYPVNVEWFLARAHLQYHEDCTGDDDEDLPGVSSVGTQQNLLGPPWVHGASFGFGHPDAHCGEDDTGDTHPPHRAISTIAADPDGLASAGSLTTGYADQQTWLLPDLPEADQLGSTNPADWKSYFHAYPAADGGVMLQYWHVFAYNALGVGGIGHHGGDWDATIHVHLAPDLRTVEWVWFSRHSNDAPGDRLQPGDVTWVDGTHPLMAIDGGGHAAFASPADFAGHHSVAGGTIAWPGDPSDPLNPAKLSFWSCPTPGPVELCPHASGAGGIVWRTWDGGEVTASANLTHPIAAPSPNGGMVNLGEYNPCTSSTCYESWQASSLLAGEFHPLNGQVFIRYSGRWGNLGSELPGAGVPPRGPVFQGWDEDKRTYTAWYNEASLTPASAAWVSWRQPPAVASTLAGPSFEHDGKTFVTPATRLSLAATENATAAGFGAAALYVRAYAAGSTPPPFQPYAGPVSLPPGDATYTVEDYAVDPLGNVSAVEQGTLVLDSVAPATTHALAGPSVELGGVEYVSPATTVSLSATLDGGLAGTPIDTEVRVYPAGTAAPAFRPYAGPFSVTGADGAYRIEYRSTDVLGNVEPTRSLELTLDSVAPATARSLDGPSATRAGTTFVAGSTRVVLTPSLASPIAALGTTTLVRVYPAGTRAPAFAPYAGAFGLPAPDGVYRVDYESRDALGNAEAPQSVLLARDTTAPAVSIAAPTASDYVHSATLTLDYAATDAGAGVSTVTATLDGRTTVGGHGLASGQAIRLLTELSLGAHTLAVTATDAVGNRTTSQVTFEVVVTAASVAADVPQLVASGGIAANRARSLSAKLEAASAGGCARAANVYRAFLNEVRAQTGKGITRPAAAILTADARYLIDHC